MERREFIQNLSLTTAALCLPLPSFGKPHDSFGQLLPLRKLGNTGEKVTMLGVGGFHLGNATERDAQEIIEAAIAGGIRFFDTAYAYGQGASETRMGKYLTPKYRDAIFLMTKSVAPNYDTARKELEESLRRLNTDTIDLWQLHSLKTPEDVDGRIQNGVLKLAEEALHEKKVRYIGFTSHTNPYALLRMLEQVGNSGLLSTMQCPVNPIDAQSEHSFIAKALPMARDHNIGILAMKTLADGRFFNTKTTFDKLVWETNDPLIPNYTSVEEVLQFSWSLPISTLITGADNAALLNEKIGFARRMVKLKEKQRNAIINKLAAYPEINQVEYYKKA